MMKLMAVGYDFYEMVLWKLTQVRYTLHKVISIAKLLKIVNKIRTCPVRKPRICWLQLRSSNSRYTKVPQTNNK